MAQYRATWADGVAVCWRSLTLKEYKTFQERRHQKAASLFWDIYQVVVTQGPEDWDKIPAGVVEFIGKHELLENGFPDEEKRANLMLMNARHLVRTDFYTSSETMIAAAFPSVDFQEIESYDPDTFFLRLAQAEAVLGTSATPADPNKQPAAKGKSKRKPQSEVEVETFNVSHR